jgi:hypothetical protein
MTGKSGCTGTSRPVFGDSAHRCRKYAKWWNPYYALIPKVLREEMESTTSFVVTMALA